MANLPEDIEEIEQELEAEDERNAARAATPAWIIHPDDGFEHLADPHELRYRVAGSPVHVRCEDTPLRDTAEAWGTAFVLPAAHADAALVLPSPPDPTWVAGVQANVALTSSWWGGPTSLTIRPDAAVDPSPTRPSPGRAIAFTGGVDSFFSLLRGDHQPTHLLFVLGYDVPLADHARCLAADQLIRHVAAAQHLTPIVISTDLRSHPAFDAISWEHTHGAAIAMAGHLVTGAIGTLVIPPSYAEHRLIPWGSSPELDPRWGVPGRLTVEHGDNSGTRLDRVLAIADEPLVHRHLRVCWEATGPEPNCGRCEKCVRTMTQFEVAGRLPDCVTFPGRHDLAGAIAGLGAVPEHHRMLWQDLVDAGLGGEPAAQVRALLARSAP